MTLSLTLLELIARVNPAIWELIGPHVPVLYTSGEAGSSVAGRFGRAGEAELNPQPLPPREQILIGAARLAQQLVEAAIAQGSDRGTSLLLEEIEDWCGTRPRPLPFPWPSRWPIPIYWPPVPDPGPGPDPELDREIFTVAAVALASLAARIGDEGVVATLGKAVDRLVEAATSRER